MGSGGLCPPKAPYFLSHPNKMKHKTARKHRSRKHRSRKHRGGKRGEKQRRIDNLIIHLQETTQELAECKRALAQLRAIRALPPIPGSLRSTRPQTVRGIRGVSPPLSDIGDRPIYAVPTLPPTEFTTYAAPPSNSHRRHHPSPPAHAIGESSGPDLRRCLWHPTDIPTRPPHNRCLMRKVSTLPTLRRLRPTFPTPP